MHHHTQFMGFWAQTQDLTHDKQVIYQLTYIPSPTNQKFEKYVEKEWKHQNTLKWW